MENQVGSDSIETPYVVIFSKGVWQAIHKEHAYLITTASSLVELRERMSREHRTKLIAA